MEIKNKKISKNKQKFKINYVICEYNNKIELLYSYIKRNYKEKIIIFFSTQKTLDFIKSLLDSLIKIEDFKIKFSLYKNVSGVNYNRIIFYDYFKINKLELYKKNLIFLNDFEKINFLKDKDFNKFEFTKSKLYSINSKIEKLIDGNYFLNKLSRDSFKEYAKYYISEFNDFERKDLRDLIKGFGLKQVPKINC